MPQKPSAMDTAHMSIQHPPTEQPQARPHSHSSASLISLPSRNPTPSSNITSPIPSTTSSIDFPSSISSHSSSPFAIDANGMSAAEPGTPSDPESPTAQPTSQPSDVDPQILEALRSKDRIYVLKLGELMEGLIKERRPRVDLTPATSYQRLLVHRCSAYYRLAPESDPTTKGIFVLPTTESRIPTRRICELVPAEATAQPAFKIMRRSPPDRRPKLPRSQAGSVAGEDADLSDIEPSESGSLGGRSNATGGSTKKRMTMTIEEREAAYNEARSRIFMDFEEKEKAKDKDMSSSSSSLSLVSGSASFGGDGSSVGDMDDSASSPATESEWSGPSGPLTRDKKESRRGGSGNASASSSTRSLRSNAPSFHANGNGSSRNSRAPSPSFIYPSLYEPASSGQMYDPSQLPGQLKPGYHPAQYIYPYSAPNQPLNQPYGSHFPYYAPQYNTYQPPPHHPPRDSSDSSIPEHYPPLQSMNFGNPYLWPPPPLQSPPHMQQHLPLPPHQPQPPQHSMTSPPPHSPHYQPYVTPSHPYPYPIPGYYPPPPPGQHVPPPPPHMGMQQPMYEITRAMNGNVAGNDPNGHVGSGTGRPNLGNGVIPNSNGRSTARNGIGPGVVNGGSGNGKHRNGPSMPPPTRSAWSYGPGVGIGGYVSQSGTNGGEAIGPRLNSTRRQSGNSSSSNSRASSNCDDVSSTASSSTTSSSSRRTYTSTTSSQHPLPPRPDWAVGMKAQPSLRHLDHSLTNPHTTSPISPSRPLNGNTSAQSNVSPRQPLNQEQIPMVSLQSTDFPPLTPLVSPAEKRNPVVNGAWGNSSSARTILSPNTGHQPVLGNTLVSHGPSSRLEESERGLERPIPKSSELYNPKIVRRIPGSPNGRMQGDREREAARGDAVASAILVAQIERFSLEEKGSTEHSLVVSAS